jgi:hypothetical protein
MFKLKQSTLLNNGTTTNKPATTTSTPTPKIPPKKRGVDPSFDYKTYWEKRYADGKNSGSGSYGENATFKANIINRIIKEYECKDMVEFGCGDGNQMSLLTRIPYIGYDISKTIIQKNQIKYKTTPNVKFMDMDMCGNYSLSADLSICVDVLFHLTIEDDWYKLIDHVCVAAKKVIVIVTNTEKIHEEYFQHVNMKRKILPVLDARSDVIIDEVITQPTHKESNTIILRKTPGE